MRLTPTMNGAVVLVCADRITSLAYGTPAYEVAMTALRWGKQRGYRITWLDKYAKPHLYRVTAQAQIEAA